MAMPSWWTQRRFGLLVHANLASVPAWAPIGQHAGWYHAHTDGRAKDVLLHPSPMAETMAHHRDRWAHIENYDDFFPFLTFDQWDPDAWTTLARDSGMGYAVMVAKHHDGLCWWDAPATDRTVMHDGPARNVLGEFAAACERASLVFGTHFSLLDWGDQRYPSAEYVESVVHPQVLDLVRRYGSKMLWGDGHWGAGGAHWRSDELVAAARAIDPEIVINDRWWHDGPTVCTYEYRLPDGIVDRPWEHRRGLGGSFGYNRCETADHLLSGAGIVALLTEVVAKGGHLLLSVGPDASGRIPELHAERLRAAGGWVRRHQDLVDRGQPWTTWGDDECRYLVLDGVLHAVDVGGRGRFAALGRAGGTVTAVIGADGESVAFEQTDRGVELTRPPRKLQRLPVAYRIERETPAPAPIQLFPDAGPAELELATAISGAKAGDVVQLGDGRYIGPARIPDGVTVRGLGRERTSLDGLESCAVTLGKGSRLEHCAVVGGGDRIVWLPKPVVQMAGDGAVLLGCHVDGHVAISGDDARIVSCSMIGAMSADVDRVEVTRSTFRGMNWDCGIELKGGSGHTIDSCKFDQFLVAVRLHDTVGATVRRNRITSRWWGVQLIDTEGSVVAGNNIGRTMRAVDVDGGAHAEIAGNAVTGGDSGCLLQRGAASVEVAGNLWNGCRIGLLAWDSGEFRQHDNTAADLGESDGKLVIGP